MPSKEMAKLQRGESHYGHPLSEEQAAVAMPIGDSGLIRHALIVPNKFLQEEKLREGLPKGDIIIETETQTVKLKPLRPSLPVKADDFFSSLTKIQGPDGPRWIFHGVLNGWPGLTCLELISLQDRRCGLFWKHHWSADREGKAGQNPEISDDHCMYRATLRSAPWTSIGWSKDNKGFVFWYEAVGRPEPRLNYGTKMVGSMNDDDICTMVHMFSHRHAMKKESLKDRLKYHSMVLLEWNHGKYCTVVEVDFLNHVGGLKGRSNWYHDKNESETELFRALPNEMKVPWSVTASEIHCFDVEAKNLHEFKTYIKNYEFKTYIEKYEGKSHRFVDPRYTFSHQARVAHRSKKDIARYLLNYSLSDCTYHVTKRNCQTFAADICLFLAGENSEPFHPISRISYVPRPHLCLYERFSSRRLLKKVGPQ